MNKDNLNLNKDDLRIKNLMLKIENEALKSKDKNNLVTLEMYKKLMEENTKLKKELDDIWNVALDLFGMLKSSPDYLKLIKDLPDEDRQCLTMCCALRNFNRFLDRYIKQGE